MQVKQFTDHNTHNHERNINNWLTVMEEKYKEFKITDPPVHSVSTTIMGTDRQTTFSTQIYFTI